MQLQDYLESTYLKTSKEACLTESQNLEAVQNLIQEAIKYKFKLAMVRVDYLSLANELIAREKSNLLLGTVVDFPLGDCSAQIKIQEAKKAIEIGVDELDFVCDYNAFKRGLYEKFDNDILLCTKLVLSHNKVIKWIIETGALSKKEIRGISSRINQIVGDYFSDNYSKIFIKTSTGYYGGYGANIKDIQLIKSVAEKLQCKASGGISTLEQCHQMINAGANRIGTSKAKEIYDE